MHKKIYINLYYDNISYENSDEAVFSYEDALLAIETESSYLKKYINYDYKYLFSYCIRNINGKYFVDKIHLKRASK